MMSGRAPIFSPRTVSSKAAPNGSAPKHANDEGRGRLRECGWRPLHELGEVEKEDGLHLVFARSDLGPGGRRAAQEEASSAPRFNHAARGEAVVRSAM